MKRDELTALAEERGELVRKNDAATSWGAAVGARAERIREIDRRIDALRTLASRQAEPVAWRPMRETPACGGTYMVGGYIEDGVLPRYFARDFASLRLTVSGPEWSLHGNKNIPMQYWHQILAHPEHQPTEIAPPATDAVREALDLLQLQQRGRATALRLLDKGRSTSNPVTLAQADAYEECGLELKAALAQRGSKKSDGGIPAQAQAQMVSEKAKSSPSALWAGDPSDPEISSAIKEAIDCISDLGSGKGGWAWEEVIQRLSAVVEAVTSSDLPSINWQISQETHDQIAEIDRNSRDAMINASNIVAGAIMPGPSDPIPYDPVSVEEAQPRWRHKKRGTIYTEIGRGRFQSSQNPVADYQEIVVYRGLDGKWWARSVYEFDDGRFERIAPSSSATR